MGNNFIDKTFTVLADSLFKVLPFDSKAKIAFSFYRRGLTAHNLGNYAEALDNYSEALKIEEDFLDRSIILLNIAIIYQNNAQYGKAIEFYNYATALNPRLTQAYNNLGCLWQHCGKIEGEKKRFDNAEKSFGLAAAYFRRASRLEPNKYIEAENWLDITGR